jgi:hypothetical protein
LDCLPQVRGGFGSSTTSRRKTSHHPSMGSPLRRLLRLHQCCPTLIKWPPGADGASNLVRRAWTSEGHGVLQATWLSPLFYAIDPDNLSGLDSSKKAGPSIPRRLLRPREGTQRPTTDYVDHTTSWERDLLHTTSPRLPGGPSAGTVRWAHPMSAGQSRVRSVTDRKLKLECKIYLNRNALIQVRNTKCGSNLAQDRYISRSGKNTTRRYKSKYNKCARDEVK